jgi:hypothetical protein
VGILEMSNEDFGTDLNSCLWKLEEVREKLFDLIRHNGNYSSEVIMYFVVLHEDIITMQKELMALNDLVTSRSSEKEFITFFSKGIDLDEERDIIL